MRPLLPLLGLLTLLPPASATTPAPLNGIWKLTGMTGVTASFSLTSLPPAELFIVGNDVRGQIGCGRYQGSIEAAAHSLRVRVAPLPPRPEERCLLAVPGAFHAALNAADRYVVSGDTRHLVMFSRTARLTFQRIGYVTPTRK